MAQSQHQLLENEHLQDPLFDSLYCQEEHWEDEPVVIRPDVSVVVVGEEEEDDEYFSGDCRQPHGFSYNTNSTTTLSINDDEEDNNNRRIEPPGVENRTRLQIPEDLNFSWEPHELSALFSKELDMTNLHNALQSDPLLALARRDATTWMLRVCAHYSFSLLTASLAVDYFDRFLSGFSFQREKPWMNQLAAVACLSLAAKVEETHVPLLLDLQVEETKYLFEAKTIQRMEILVLSTLDWKMNSVTPYSFLDYMTRRLGLKRPLCWEFLRRCERVLLAVLRDCRSLCYLPSVVASATMLHAVNSMEPCIRETYQTQMLGILGMAKDKVEACGFLIGELASDGSILLSSNKRKSVSMPGSPNGVIDVSFSSDSSNDSWAVNSSPSVSSSPEPLGKKMRRSAGDQNQLQLERLLFMH